jgi:hypothetical protein
MFRMQSQDDCIILTDGAFCSRYPEFAGSRQFRVRSKLRAEFYFVCFKYKNNDRVCQWDNYTNSLSLANFVGSVVGFLNVLVIRWMPARRMPGRLLLAASLSFESEMVLQYIL